jgi:hypothetical protein
MPVSLGSTTRQSNQRDHLVLHRPIGPRIGGSLDLSNRLAERGRREAALETIKEGLRNYRQLEESWP